VWRLTGAMGALSSSSPAKSRDLLTFSLAAASGSTGGGAFRLVALLAAPLPAFGPSLAPWSLSVDGWRARRGADASSRVETAPPKKDVRLPHRPSIKPTCFHRADKHRWQTNEESFSRVATQALVFFLSTTFAREAGRCKLTWQGAAVSPGLNLQRELPPSSDFKLPHASVSQKRN
jgi:hypothetical protein